jgi:hypothetical protein
MSFDPVIILASDLSLPTYHGVPDLFVLPAPCFLLTGAEVFFSKATYISQIATEEVGII